MAKQNDKNEESLGFDEIFGAFQAASMERNKEPMAKIITIGEDYAQPCHDCGSQPALHILNFSDKKKYPDNVYICCSHCSACNGKRYRNEKDALYEWNELNIGSKPRDPSKKDIYDFVEEIMKNVTFSD